MANQLLPLIYDAAHAQDIAYCNGQWISRQQFLQHVIALSSRLPERQYLINLCQDRYHFMVAFAAAIIRHQVNLLPSNQTTGEVRKLADEYPDSYVLSDQPSVSEVTTFKLDIADLKNDVGHVELPYVTAEQLVAIVFTSGSTGQAKANRKYWHSLFKGTELLASRFGFLDSPKSVVATVVPQHMFGLETSVLLPLLTNTCVHADKPFYPADISKVLSDLVTPVVLVTTPVHLKACVNSDIEWPKFEFVLSATAPLSTDLARSVQLRMGVAVREIFGCTEAGSFASRQTLKDNAWKLYDTFSMKDNDGSSILQAPHLTEQITLSDIIEEQGDGLFKVLGRSADMLKIAGKRASLADLNVKLNRIEQVQDGVFFVPDEAPDHDRVARVCAIVVAPGLTESELFIKLSDVIDSVFLPRPLILVKQLPYNDIGKLPRRALDDVYRQYRNRAVQ